MTNKMFSDKIYYVARLSNGHRAVKYVCVPLMSVVQIKMKAKKEGLDFGILYEQPFINKQDCRQACEFLNIENRTGKIRKMLNVIDME